MEMIMSDNEKLLRQEREKLDRLIDEALQNGKAINEAQEIQNQSAKGKRMERKALQSEAVQAQSRKVDKLIEEVERKRK
jgi:IDEAL domain.